MKVYFKISILYLNLKNYKKSLFNIKKTLDCSFYLNNIKYEALSYYLMSLIYFYQNKID